MKPIERRIEEIENAITGWESDLESLNLEMQAATQKGNGTRIADLSMSLHDVQEKIDKGFENLDALYEEVNALGVDFDARLEALEAKKPF